jgi:hypothetical protein
VGSNDIFVPLIRSFFGCAIIFRIECLLQGHTFNG